MKIVKTLQSAKLNTADFANYIPPKYSTSNLYLSSFTNHQGWGQVQLTKYSSTPSTPSI